MVKANFESRVNFRVVTRYIRSGIKGLKRAWIRDNGPGNWSHNAWDRNMVSVILFFRLFISFKFSCQSSSLYISKITELKALSFVLHCKPSTTIFPLNHMNIYYAWSPLSTLIMKGLLRGLMQMLICLSKYTVAENCQWKIQMFFTISVNKSDK